MSSNIIFISMIILQTYLKVKLPGTSSLQKSLGPANLGISVLVLVQASIQGIEDKKNLNFYIFNTSYTMQILL